jgi:peptidoglycan hydrolase-like protein with peptidoglycan-binding domain
MKALWKLKRGIAGLAAAVLVCATASAASSPNSTKNATAASHPAAKLKSAKSKKASKKGKRSKRVRGQQKIDKERTHQIQEALIKQKYLSGEASGKWDASTEAALRKFQADNGWQNKTVPDSRALIKLGLGPNHDHLLNPESAMTTTPETPRAAEASTPAAKGPSASDSQPQP